MRCALFRLWILCPAGGRLLPLPHHVSLDAFRVRKLSWRSGDGVEIEGFLYWQEDGQGGAITTTRPQPLLVHAHGGPALAKPLIRSDATNATRYPFRHLLAAGYLIFMPNFRGTLGYGDEFASANVGTQGRADLEDIKTGVHPVSYPVSFQPSHWPTGLANTLHVC